jgi:hypothetical protein
LLLCTGCAGGTPSAAPHDGAPSDTPESVAVRPSSTSSTVPPSPGDLRTPATTSGSLSQHSFPRPHRLGAGWDYAVDPGDTEEGYLGNGTPALARDPREMVQAAVPLGCARRVALPSPAHALEVDYTYRGTKVVAVRMSFPDAAGAARFYGARTADLTDCRGRSAGAGIGVLVRSVADVGGHAVLSDRTPDSDPWSELAVLDGTDVVLVAAQSSPGTRPLTRDGARTLAAAFRR